MASVVELTGEAGTVLLRKTSPIASSIRLSRSAISLLRMDSSFVMFYLQITIGIMLMTRVVLNAIDATVKNLAMTEKTVALRNLDFDGFERFLIVLQISKHFC